MMRNPGVSSGCECIDFLAESIKSKPYRALHVVSDMPNRKGLFAPAYLTDLISVPGRPLRQTLVPFVLPLVQRPTSAAHCHA